MAYVYDKVGSDTQSRQTPHFGFIDGDGDFIFDTSALAELDSKSSSSQSDSEPEVGLDILIKAPSFQMPSVLQEETVAEIMKRLISNPSETIKLSDYVSALI